MADPAESFLIARNPDPDSTLPFLLRLPIDGGVLLKARDRWPTTARVYCHPLDEWPADAEIVEQVAIRSCRRRGAAIDLVLDRGEQPLADRLHQTQPRPRQCAADDLLADRAHRPARASRPARPDAPRLRACAADDPHRHARALPLQVHRAPCRARARRAAGRRLRRPRRRAACRRRRAQDPRRLHQVTRRRVAELRAGQSSPRCRRPRSSSRSATARWSTTSTPSPAGCWSRRRACRSATPRSRSSSPTRASSPRNTPTATSPPRSSTTPQSTRRPTNRRDDARRRDRRRPRQHGSACASRCSQRSSARARMRSGACRRHRRPRRRRPGRVVDLVRERCALVLAGNHDRWVTGDLPLDMLPLPPARRASVATQPALRGAARVAGRAAGPLAPRAMSSSGTGARRTR